MKNLTLITLLIITSCKSNPAHTVQISIDKKAGGIRVTGLATVTLQGIERDSISIKTWQSLFPVYSMPADTAMRNYQWPLPGHYAITNNAIKFIPYTAFKAGQTYFARYYNYDKPISAMDVVLHRRALGQGTYTELIFKY